MMNLKFLMCASEFWGPVSEVWTRIGEWFEGRKIALLGFALGVVLSIVCAAALDWFIRRVLKRVAKRTKPGMDDCVIEALHGPLVWGLTLSGIALSVNVLSLSPKATKIIFECYFLLLSLIITWGLLRIVDVVCEFFTQLAKKTEHSLDDLLVTLLRPTFRTIIWCVSILFIAENIFNFNMAALLAGAGVAAMAIAFAAQNTIANIFGAISLILDRPFSLGDMIVVNDKRGSVEAIGLRSTRVRSLDGTLWTIPNKEMSEATIENISRRPNIKQIFNIGLVYGTTPEQMRRGIAITREILEQHPLTDMEIRPPLIFFAEIKDWALNIQAIEWFQTGDFAEFCRAREEVNFAIMTRFAAEGLEFAYPSQTLYLAGDSARPLCIGERGEAKK